MPRLSSTLPLVALVSALTAQGVRAQDWREKWPACCPSECSRADGCSNVAVVALGLGDNLAIRRTSGLRRCGSS